MNTIQKVSLFFKDGSSDKEYNLQLVETVGGYIVTFQYGRRGSSLTSGTKTPTPVPLEAATKIYNKLIAEKTGKGYKPGNDSGSGTFIQATNIPAAKKIVFIPQLLNPIDESEIESYLKDDSYGAQEKMDGRHQAFSKKAGQVQVTNKKGQVIGYPETLKQAIQTNKDILVDSEAIGETYHAFDILEADGKDLRSLGYETRYKVLIAQTFKSDTIKLVPLAIGYKEKQALYDNLKAAGKEGIVFKKLNAKYSPGKAHNAMWKCKFYATASVIVLKHNDKNSIEMGLIDKSGKVIGVGNLTMIGHEKDPINSIIEVRYLYFYKGGSFYQPTYIGPRDDIDYNECSFEKQKIKYKPEGD